MSNYISWKAFFCSRGVSFEKDRRTTYDVNEDAKYSIRVHVLCPSKKKGRLFQEKCMENDRSSVFLELAKVDHAAMPRPMQHCQYQRHNSRRIFFVGLVHIQIVLCRACNVRCLAMTTTTFVREYLIMYIQICASYLAWSCSQADLSTKKALCKGNTLYAS